MNALTHARTHARTHAPTRTRRTHAHSHAHAHGHMHTHAHMITAPNGGQQSSKKIFIFEQNETKKGDSFEIDSLGVMNWNMSCNNFGWRKKSWNWQEAAKSLISFFLLHHHFPFYL